MTSLITRRGLQAQAFRDCQNRTSNSDRTKSVFLWFGGQGSRVQGFFFLSAVAFLRSDRGPNPLFTEHALLLTPLPVSAKQQPELADSREKPGHDKVASTEQAQYFRSHSLHARDSLVLNPTSQVVCPRFTRAQTLISHFSFTALQLGLGV